MRTVNYADPHYCMLRLNLERESVMKTTSTVGNTLLPRYAEMLLANETLAVNDLDTFVVEPLKPLNKNANKGKE